jgi:hypothetical protein
VREHRYSFEMPHSAARVWALLQDDEHHNGRLRRVISELPFGREGSALELVTDVVPERSDTYTMLSNTPGNDQIGHVRLDPLGPNRTMFHFDERCDIAKWFEGPICTFANEHNEASKRRASTWLRTHPEYRADLVDRPAERAGRA